MKKTIYLFIFILALGGNAFAQTENTAELAEPAMPPTPNFQGSFGVIVGTDIGGAVPFPLSNIPSPFNAYPQIHPSMGFGVSFNLIKGWGLAAELTYKTVGMKADARVKNQKFSMDGADMYFTGSAKMEMEFSMLEVPLYVKYQFKNNKDRVSAGFYFSHVLSSSFVTDPQKGYVGSRPDIADITDMSNINMDFGDYLDNWDLGFLLGYERQIFNRLNLGLRFSMGLKDIFKPSNRYFEYNMLHMRGSIMLSYSLVKTKSLFKSKHK